MVAINYAKDIRVGEQPAKAVALGANFVWPPLPERLFFRGQSLAYDFVRQRYGTRRPGHVTIVAGETPVGSGYISEAFATRQGAPDLATGSISAQPLPGIEIEGVLFGATSSASQLIIYFLGDVASSLVGIRVWVGGVELAGTPDIVDYYPQENITTAAYNNPNMDPWVDGGQYNIGITLDGSEPSTTIDYTTNVNDLGIVTRASTATYWGPEGSLLEAAVDEARIQHDPVTGKPLGLLMESGATNLLLWSEDFTQGGGWSSVSASRTTSGFVLNTGSGRVFQNIPDLSGTFTISARFSPEDTGKLIRFTVRDDHLSFTGDGRSPVFEIPPDGLLSHTWHSLSNANLVGLINGGMPAGTSFTLREDCGIQLEEGSHPTSYIPTSGSPVTRAADNAVIDLSDVLNPDEGTFFFEWEAWVGGGPRQMINFNRMFRVFEATVAGSIGFSWGVTGVTTIRSSVSGYTKFKLALSYSGQQAQFAIAIGDTTYTESTDTEFRIDSSLHLFNRPQGDRAADGIFKTVEYYPETVSEERLIQMVGGGS